MIRCDRIRNETNLTDALKHCLVSKWKWAGHIARVKDKRWSQRVTHWAGPTGKRKIGKPKKRWVDNITSTAGENWMAVAQDREKWRKLEEAFTRMGLKNTKI